MYRFFILVVFQLITLFPFAQKQKRKFHIQTIYFSINEGIIDKKVLLFEGETLSYDPSKELEFYKYSFDKADSASKRPSLLLANKISWELLVKKNPTLAKDTTTRIMRVDPISGEPVVYSKERLKEFYVAWQKDFFKEKHIVKHIDNDSSSILVFTDKLLGRKIYIGVYTQIKANKIQVVVRDLGKVRTKDNPKDTEIYASFCYHIPVLDKCSNWYKIRSILKFKNRMNYISENLMDFILHEGDFVDRILDNKLLNYNSRFNF